MAAGALDTDLAVTMSVQPGTYKLGDEILYTMTITNNGPRVATGINFADTLPAGAQFISLDSSSGLNLSGGVASVFVGALAPGDSVQAFVSLKSTVAGDITNTAMVTLVQSDSNPANNTFSLVTHILPGASVTVLSATPNSSTPATASISPSTSFRRRAASRRARSPSAKARPTSTPRRSTATARRASSQSLLTPGVHTITAFYSGDSNFAPSSMPFDVTVAGARAGFRRSHARAQMQHPTRFWSGNR